MGTGVIYMYTSPSGKKYVGQTWNEYHRHWQHGNGRSRTAIFALAVDKYGIDSMKYEVIHLGIETQEELDQLEKSEIERNDSMYPNGYNLKSGGSHGKHSIISRMKMSKAVKLSQTPDLIKILSEKGKLNWSNPEYRERMVSSFKKIKDRYPGGVRPISESNKRRSRKVRCIETGIVYDSLNKAAKAHGLSPGNISSRCKLGPSYTLGGFHWEFA